MLRLPGQAACVMQRRPAGQHTRACDDNQRLRLPKKIIALRAAFNGTDGVVEKLSLARLQGQG